jgi:ubiquinone/menaquinone biosynthesis C-methylase UbiE
MIKSYFIKNIIIRVFGKILQKNIFILSKIINFNNKNKNFQILGLGQKDLKIFNTYRYKIKIPLTQTGIKPLLFLNKKNLLSDSQKKFLKEAIGERTLGKSIEEIIYFGNKVCKNFEKFFYHESLIDDKIPSKVKLSKLENNLIINNFQNLNTNQINLYNKKIKKKLKLNDKILEIGYSTGGHSLIAFERMGFKVSGIDNFYDGNFRPVILDHIKISEQIKNNVNFIEGDISKINSEDKFDLIYSTSVLEHISDVKASLKNMYNLLNSGGSIFHNYNPYFSFNGGHALGTGDAPFMHLRLNTDEYVEYIKLYRPYESEIAIKWLKNSMNKEINQKRLKNLLINSGFKIIYFQSNNFNKFNFDIDKKIYEKCVKNYKFLDLEDLLGHSVSFIATKL